jgi:hypothetical protein
MTLVSEVWEVIACSGIEITARATAHDCLAIASRRPGEAHSRRKVIDLDSRRVQSVTPQNWDEKCGLGEVIVQGVWFVGPRNAEVHRQPWTNAPRVAGIQPIKIQNSFRSKVAPRNHTGADVGREALQGKQENIVQSVERDW